MISSTSGAVRLVAHRVRLVNGDQLRLELCANGLDTFRPEPPQPMLSVQSPIVSLHFV